MVQMFFPSDLVLRFSELGFAFFGVKDEEVVNMAMAFVPCLAEDAPTSKLHQM